MPQRAKSDSIVREVTSELSAEVLQTLLNAEETYRPVPHSDVKKGTPAWRVRLELAFDTSVCMKLELNGEITFGRGVEEPGMLSLFNSHNTESLGVSRRHALIRPSDSKLYIFDLNSTNGTWVNGHAVGSNMPHTLSDGDRVMLGRLEFIIRIVKRPSGHTGLLTNKSDTGERLLEIARTITSQLNRDDVLKHAMEITINTTGADEISIWLVDDQMGQLFFEAGRHADHEQVTRLPVNDEYASKVLNSGQPLRMNRDPDRQVKVKTGFLVEALLYVPLMLAGLPIGVMSVAHADPGKSFSANDEKVVLTIADFTAIALQNAVLHQVTEAALLRRVKTVTSLSYALSGDIKNLLSSTVGYAGMLKLYSTDADSSGIADQILEAGQQMSQLIDQLIDITNLREYPMAHQAICDLAEITRQAVNELHEVSRSKDIDIDFQIVGDPYLIHADEIHLYRSLVNLLDNAIRYSPTHGFVSIKLLFWPNEVMIRVRDTGPGVPDEDLEHLLDGYYRRQPTQQGEIGLSLGLELVQATVEAHRGSIAAYKSADEAGLEIVIMLPASLRVDG